MLQLSVVIVSALFRVLLIEVVVLSERRLEALQHFVDGASCHMLIVLTLFDALMAAVIFERVQQVVFTFVLANDTIAWIVTSQLIMVIVTVTFVVVAEVHFVGRLNACSYDITIYLLRSTLFSVQ